ncbi:glycosyltransferase family A protein [Aquimarina pacifica]|uniref:glycosyltransferase family A protein n=1 Tax=Aquimarina pacifica TaxID=1296415 RepID=UPI0004709FEF|nr:glycosyltransferase family A protein [Aquimarina pacifica]
MKNKISVIIPAYNAANFIKESIDSILAQTYPIAEIIVVDDGSTDATKDIIQQFDNIQYIYQKNQGTAVALNTGIKASKGDFFALLDHDDLWHKSKIEKQIQCFINEPSLDLVFTNITNFLSPDMDADLIKTIDFSPKTMVGIHKSALLVRTSSFLKVGMFDTNSNTQDLLEWYARFKDIGLNEYILPEVLVQRRIHGTNQTLLNKEMKNDFPKVLKAILDRRRSQ